MAPSLSHVASVNQFNLNQFDLFGFFQYRFTRSVLLELVEDVKRHEKHCIQQIYKLAKITFYRDTVKLPLLHFRTPQGYINTLL